MLLMRSAVAAFWQRRTSAAWCAGAPGCTTISCCRITACRISARRWRNWARSASRSIPPGSTPHAEFRFPQIGVITLRDIGLEIRHALEPWHVLGEEQAAGRHGALCRQLGRAVAGARDRLVARALRAGLQRRGRAAEPDRRGRGIRGRRALQGLAAAERAASDHPGAGAADVRRLRPLDRPQPGRADASRGASGRAQLRHLPGQCQRGGGPAALAVLRLRPHPGRDARAARIVGAEHPRTLDLRRFA